MSNTIQVNLLKARLTPDKDPFYIYRDSKLRFKKKQTTVEVSNDYSTDVATNHREEKEQGWNKGI